MRFEEVLPALKEGKKDLVSNKKCKDCAFQNVDCYYFDRNCWINHTNFHSNTTLDIDGEEEDD